MFPYFNLGCKDRQVGKLVHSLISDVTFSIEDELRCKQDRQGKKFFFNIAVKVVISTAVNRQTLAIKDDSIDIVAQRDHLAPNPNPLGARA